MSNNKAQEYPRQVYSAVHTKQTLGVDSYLDAATTTGTTPVLEGHTGYSRFKMTIIDASGPDRVIVSANILHSEVPYLVRQYEGALATLRADTGVAKKEETFISPAYTVRIGVGRDFKGKTPAEVLLENPANASALQRQSDWLNKPENISRYPQNAELITAIEDAIGLLNAGELHPLETAPMGGGDIEVFREDFKVMRAGKGNDDKRIGAKIAIVCDPTKKNKWGVTIENTLHPVSGISVDRETVLKRSVASIRLNDKEMALLIYKLQSIMAYFESMHFPAAWQHVLNTSYRPTE